MRWLTEDALIACEHGGSVTLDPSQDFVRIEKRRVLIEPDPENRPISGCPNSNPTIGIRSCLHTLKVKEGYSTFVRIATKPVCLDSIQGLTDGTPPGIVNYRVRTPGQQFTEANG
jgi:hypothetical protein